MRWAEEGKARGGLQGHEVIDRAIKQCFVDCNQLKTRIYKVIRKQMGTVIEQLAHLKKWNRSMVG